MTAALPRGCGQVGVQVAEHGTGHVTCRVPGQVGARQGPADVEDERRRHGREEGRELRGLDEGAVLHPDTLSQSRERLGENGAIGRDDGGGPDRARQGIDVGAAWAATASRKVTSTEATCSARSSRNARTWTCSSWASNAARSRYSS